MSESDDFRWGTVLAKLEAIEANAVKGAEEGDKATRRFERMQSEITSALGGVQNEVTAFGAKLDSHISEDNRRFGEVGEDVRRLEEGSGGPPGLAKPAAAAGGATGLVLVLNWLREMFNSSGGPS